MIEKLRFLVQQSAPGQIALVDHKGALSYSELANRITELATWLRDREVEVVAICAGNSIDWVLVDLACQVAEIICLPLPDFFSPDQ